MDEKKIWKETLDVLRLSVSSANFSTWFAQTFVSTVKEIGGDRRLVEIACPSTFIADAIEKRYFGLVQDALNQVTGEKNDLSFCVKQIERPKSDIESPLFLNTSTTTPETPNEKETEDALRRAHAKTGYTFDNFAVSSTNQMAWAASDAVSKNIGKAYNPLFIWGGVGVGKTHLMLAIVHRVLSQNIHEKILYCTGEDFTTEIVEAIRNKNTPMFKKKYRELKLLMVDDIQFIAGKITVQEEFFHTFNTILHAGGQVVLTSDQPPTEITKLEGRLRSRFEAGLIVDVAQPDFELRTAITLIKAEEKNIQITMPAAQIIAMHIDGPRKIEGFLVRIISEYGTNTTITEDIVNQILNKATNGEVKQKKTIHPQELVSAVSNYYALGKRKLLGANRAQHIARPRQVLMYLLRNELELPLQEVGRVVGGRDHTTVIHAVEKISTSLLTNIKLKEDILRIKQSLFG